MSKSSPHKEKNVSSSLYLCVRRQKLTSLTVAMVSRRVSTLYPWNVYSAVCQFYPNKAGKKKSSRGHKEAIFAKGLLGSQALSFPNQTKSSWGPAWGSFLGPLGKGWGKFSLAVFPIISLQERDHCLRLKGVHSTNTSWLERQLGTFSKDPGWVRHKC